MKKEKIEQNDWLSAEEKAKHITQAKALKKKAKKGGLRFNAYLPPQLADWLLGLIEQGTFLDPSEAIFGILGEHKDMESHSDLRHELLKRILQASIDDPRPCISEEEFIKKIRKEIAAPMPPPAVWKK